MTHFLGLWKSEFSCSCKIQTTIFFKNKTNAWINRPWTLACRPMSMTYHDLPHGRIIGQAYKSFLWITKMAVWVSFISSCNLTLTSTTGCLFPCFSQCPQKLRNLTVCCEKNTSSDGNFSLSGINTNFEQGLDSVAPRQQNSLLNFFAETCMILKSSWTFEYTTLWGQRFPALV